MFSRLVKQANGDGYLPNNLLDTPVDSSYRDLATEYDIGNQNYPCLKAVGRPPIFYTGTSCHS